MNLVDEYIRACMRVNMALSSVMGKVMEAPGVEPATAAMHEGVCRVVDFWIDMHERIYRHGGPRVTPSPSITEPPNL